MKNKLNSSTKEIAHKYNHIDQRESKEFNKFYRTQSRVLKDTISSKETSNFHNFFQREKRAKKLKTLNQRVSIQNHINIS